MRQADAVERALRGDIWCFCCHRWVPGNQYGIQSHPDPDDNGLVMVLACNRCYDDSHLQGADRYRWVKPGTWPKE